jgi:hypothetical protein
MPPATDHPAHHLLAALVAATCSAAQTGWHDLAAPLLTGLCTYGGTRLGAFLWHRRPSILRTRADSDRPPPMHAGDRTTPTDPQGGPASGKGSASWRKAG